MNHRKIFDLRIEHVDNPESNQQIVGGADVVGRHINKEMRLFLRTIGLGKKITLTYSDEDALVKYTITSCN